MKRLILITVIAIIIISSVLLAMPDIQPKAKTISAGTIAPMPKYQYTDKHRANYGLRQMYRAGAKNNLLEWEANKRLEDEQRHIEKTRKNWKRFIDGRYVFGYDERYDLK